MRFIFPGPRPARKTGGLLLALAVTAAAASPAAAQATKAKPPAPTAADARPISRYIPRDNLVVFVESEGIDAHADAWKKTAAARMLNETPLGAMLEAVGAQLADRALAMRPGNKITGADAVAVVKMLAQRGFAFGLNVDSKGEKPIHAALVVRAAAAREYRPQFSRLIGSLMGTASKPQIVKKGTRSVAVVAGPTRTWAWWAEGNDVVFGLMSPEDADVVIDTLDGKHPSAADHPIRAELVREESGFRPSGVLFVDPGACPRSDFKLAQTFQSWKQSFNRLDYRWGYQDEALMSVTRIKAEKPRKGLLALFDQPKFDRSKMPPLPEGIENFTALSLDPVKTLDALLEATPDGDQKAKLTESIDNLKSKSRIDLRKDLLAHLGPRMAYYMTPGPPASRTPGDAGGGERRAEAGPAGGGLPGLNVLNAMGMTANQPVPRYTLLSEVKDPVAFGKSLDNLMVALNRQLKEQAADAAEKMAAAANAGAGAGAPGGDAAGPRGAGGRRPGAAGGAGAPGGGGRAGVGPVAAPEFKLMPGKPTEKVYVLQVPAGGARRLPPGVRPTVRLSGKMLAVSTTPDAARLALEVKPGEWTVPNDLAAAFDQVPKELIVLSVNDPRPTNPEILANLPGTIQAVVGATVAMGQLQAAGGANFAAGGPGAGGRPGLGGGAGLEGDAPVGGGGAVGGNKNLRGPRGGGAGAPGFPMAGGGPPGGMPFPGGGPPGSGNLMAGGPGGFGTSMNAGGMPGPGGAPGAPGGAPGAAGPLQITVDPDKMPKADDLRSRMFPGAFAVTADDQEVKIISRESFPDVVSVTAGGGVAAGLLMPALQAARQAALKAAGGKPGAAGIPGVPGAPNPGGAASPPGSRPGTPPTGPGGAAPGASPGAAPG